MEEDAHNLVYSTFDLTVHRDNGTSG